MITPGAASAEAVDLLVQEAIVLGLGALAQERRAQLELVDRSDALRLNTASDWRRQLQGALSELLDPAEDRCVLGNVLLGYPSPGGEARLPAISILRQSGGEDASKATIGNVIREWTEPHGPNDERWLTMEFGCVHTSTIQIGAWAPQPELGILLIAAVRWALYQQTQRLVEHGVHDITTRDGGVEPSEDLYPRVGYVPMVTLTCSWMFRQTTRGRCPNRVTIRPMFTT